jgi:hypothetical protein
MDLEVVVVTVEEDMVEEVTEGVMAEVMEEEAVALVQKSRQKFKFRPIRLVWWWGKGVRQSKI